jgi:hypothetical protein
MVTASPQDAFLGHFLGASYGFRGRIFVLSGYFDETVVQHGPPLTGVGGFLFDADSVAKFDAAWGPEIAQLKKPFHTSACGGRQGRDDFADWSSPKRDDFLKKLARITADTRDAGFVSTVLHSDYDKFISKNPGHSIIAGSPYTLALMACVDAARNYMEKNYPDEDIYYWFEAGAPKEKEAQEFMRRLKNHKNSGKYYRVAGYSFVEKKHAPALCSADFLCWEWQRNYVEADHDEKDGTMTGTWRENFKLLFKDKGSKPIHPNQITPARMEVRAIINVFYRLYKD